MYFGKVKKKAQFDFESKYGFKDPIPSPSVIGLINVNLVHGFKNNWSEQLACAARNLVSTINSVFSSSLSLSLPG